MRLAAAARLVLYPFALVLTWMPLEMAAQDVPVYTAQPIAVGAITRDTGMYTGPADLATMKSVNRYLTLLEADLAGRISSLDDVRYQDRTSTRELMHELHLSSGPDFDPFSGALRGLMGRLDYLIVIDAIDPSTAKMRLIDVQSGAVRGVETCTGRTSQGAACIVGMANRVEAVGRARNGVIGNLAAQRAELMTVKPAWDDQVARYDAAKAFWGRIQGQLSSGVAGGGHSVRPEVQTLLNGAATDVQTGGFAVQHLDVNTLKAATLTLGTKLDKLEMYR